MKFLLVRDGATLGDYGHFTNSGSFCRKGNIFSDIKSLSSEADITLRQHEVRLISNPCHTLVTLDNLALSLPNNHAFNSQLASLSP